MSEFRKYHDIGQFRNVIREVEQAFGYSPDESGEWIRNNDPLPTLEFEGTVKIHGTNGAIRINPELHVTAQSRQRDLSVDSDNAGFAQWVKRNEAYFSGVDIALIAKYPEHKDDDLIIYGEWCGPGIHKGVAVNQLDNRIFVVFDIKLGDRWLPKEDVARCYNHLIGMYSIYDFPTCIIKIDFNNPGLSQNLMIEMTEKVERECPVGKHFGISGIGEGIVFKVDTPKGRFILKSKGEKHSISRVKKLNPVDVEKLNSITEFVEYAVTENRLHQGVAEVLVDENDCLDFDRKKLGDFIRWISSDINKEENDTLFENGLTMKDVGSSLSKKARQWFFEQEKI